MSFDRRAPQSSDTTAGGPGNRAPVPGKHTLIESLPETAPIQRAAASDAAAAPRDDAAVHASAARGVATPASALPHAAQIQQLFGRHDISAVQAHSGPEAGASARAMGATAYATGNHVVLDGTPTLFTAAHEAAHVVQQRGGVQLQGGVGAQSDAYEQHADAVASLVVEGKSAEGLLDAHAGRSASGDSGGKGGGAVQRMHSQASSSVLDDSQSQDADVHMAGTTQDTTMAMTQPASPPPASHIGTASAMTVRRDDTVMHGDDTTVHPDDGYGSDFASSEGDTDTELSAQEKLRILQNKGQIKVAKSKNKHVAGDRERRDWNNPRRRQVYTTQRVHGDAVDINQDDRGIMGQQTVRVGEGNGFFIQPGKNTNRPKNVKEPPADYEALISALRGMAKDRNTAALLGQATGKSVQLGTTLSDPDLARIIFKYMNNDLTTTDRSPLTEHLSKLVAIFEIAESGRALQAEAPAPTSSDDMDGDADDEADLGASNSKGKEKANKSQHSRHVPAPYDARLLIKGGLQHVIQGKITLKQLFYDGDKGSDSVFLGAPSDGGAARLRRPTDHPEALERQMAIFPDNKKAYKHTLNSMATGSQTAIPDVTPEQASAAAAARLQERRDEAEKLASDIKDTPLPTDPGAVLDFNSQSGPLERLKRRLNKLRGEPSDDAQLNELIAKADQALKDKRAALHGQVVGSSTSTRSKRPRDIADTGDTGDGDGGDTRAKKR